MKAKDGKAVLWLTVVPNIVLGVPEVKFFRSKPQKQLQELKNPLKIAILGHIYLFSVIWKCVETLKTSKMDSPPPKTWKKCPRTSKLDQ